MRKPLGVHVGFPREGETGQEVLCAGKTSCRYCDAPNKEGKRASERAEC